MVNFLDLRPFFLLAMVFFLLYGFDLRFVLAFGLDREGFFMNLYFPEANT